MFKEEYPIDNSIKCHIVNKMESINDLDFKKRENKQNLTENLITNVILESDKKIHKTGKKKLNLQEYKQRRENSNSSYSQKSNSQSNVFNYRLSVNNSIENTIFLNSQTDNNNLKKLNNLEFSNQVLDPILEASKKAIRNQELKKGEIIKKSEPVIRVQDPISIFPLDEINSQHETINAKDNQNIQKLIINPNFEEIIIVSIGCNTNLTIPANNSNTTYTEQNMMLLYNISDTIKKAKSFGENIVISSNSLISSIKDVVLKISNPIAGNPDTHASTNTVVLPSKNVSTVKPEELNLGFNSVNTISNDDNDHGEDRTIMHLRKDRIRPRTHTISIQTEDSSVFSVLKRLSREYIGSKSNSYKKEKYTERRYRKRGISSSSNSDYEYKKKTKCDNRRDNFQPSRNENNRSISPKYSAYKRNSDQRSFSFSKDRRPTSRNSIISRSSSSSNRSRSRHRRYSTSSQSSNSSARSISREHSHHHRKGLNKNNREASPGN